MAEFELPPPSIGIILVRRTDATDAEDAARGIIALTGGEIHLAFALYLARRFDEAALFYTKALDMSPDYWGGHYYLSMVLLANKMPEAALVEIRKETLPAFQLTGLAHIQHALGNAAESIAALTELVENHSSGYAYQIAASLAFRSEIDEAFVARAGVHQSRWWDDSDVG